MPREEVVMRVDMTDRGDPISRAFDAPSKAAAAAAEQARQMRQRAEMPPIRAERAQPIRATDVIADRDRLRRSGVFLGAGGFGPPPITPESPQGGGGGGGGRPPRRPGPRRPRGGGIGSDPLQLGQIFQTGRIGAQFGLRAAGLATLGGVGAGLLVFDAALSRAIDTVGRLDKAFQQQIQTMAQFSPAVATAVAQGEISRTLAQIQTAQRFGANFAQTQRRRNQLEELQIRLAAELLDFLQPTMRAILDIQITVLKMVEDIGVARAILTALATALEPWIPGITLLIDRALEWLEREDAPMGDDFFQDQLRFFSEPVGTFTGARGMARRAPAPREP